MPTEHICPKCGGPFLSEVVNFCPYCRTPIGEIEPLAVSGNDATFVRFMDDMRRKIFKAFVG